MNTAPSWAVQAQSYAFAGPDAALFYISNSEFCFGNLFFPGNSCSVSVAMRSAPPGVYHAQIVAADDGTATPLVIPLDVTELSGPALAVARQAGFGRVAVGGEGARRLSLTNTGDWPLDIAESIVVTGHPDVFFLSDDGCTGQPLDAGASCRMAVHFKPTETGNQDAALFMITGNDQTPVRSVGLTGTGVAVPDGAAKLLGRPRSGGRLTCDPEGYPADARFAFRWLRNGHTLHAATRTLPLGDADVGARLACELTARSPGGVRTARSGASAPVAPRDLDGLTGAFLGAQSCRGVTAGRTLHPGLAVTVSHGSPVTAGDPLSLRARAALRVAIDGRRIDAGPTVAVGPAQLAEWADGPHTLSVRAGGRIASEPILLTTCRLGVRVRGGDRRASAISISARAGVRSLAIALPRSMLLRTGAGRAVGILSYRRAGGSLGVLGLTGPRTEGGGVTAVLGARAVRVTGLPAETGVIRVSLRPGVLTGGAGMVRATATLRGDPGATHAVARTVWAR